MKITIRPLYFFLIISLALFQSCSQQLTTEPVSFNEGWRFAKGAVVGASEMDFDDTMWRNITLPHDWAIEGPFDSSYNARSGGLPFHGIGWYRKKFDIPNSVKGKHVTLHFDGAMNNAKVWLNGTLVGDRPYGYIGFSVDLSPYLNYGGSNVVAVQLAPEDFSSRWYPGAGIYRNTWLEINNEVHVPKWGTFITTPNITENEASVRVLTEVKNIANSDKEVSLQTVIYDPNNKEVGNTNSIVQTKQNTTVEAVQTLSVETPMLWDLDKPNLYTAMTTIKFGDTVLDTYKTTFGIRTIAYGADFGFKLNDKKTRFKGVCLHHDLGPLGAAVNKRATERQLEIMQEMGVNAIRTSHNPPSPEQVQLCDQMGLMIQVEAFDVWQMAKVKNDYSKHFDKWHERDLRDMIRSFRNSPSVVMWSIGNEILEQSHKTKGREIAHKLADICRDEDSTRPVTAGFNYYPAPINNGLAEALDLVGWNYKPRKYEEVVQKQPDWIVYGSETASTVSSRGTYHLPIKKYEKHESLQITSYDFIGPPWAYPPDIEFEALEKTPNNLGEFIWTGFDYLGEPTPYGGKDNSTNGYWNGDWPARSSYFGAVDLCGLPKDRFYLYKSQWTSAPMVHVLPHWNWEGKENEIIPVFSYTNAEEVELFVNGKSFGKKRKGMDKAPVPINFIDWEGGRYKGTFMSPYRLMWEVPYQPGSIEVVAYTNGERVAKKRINTAGEPAKIELIPDRVALHADGKDISFVTVRITDKDGNLCPSADNLVKFSVSDLGTIAAVGNGDPATMAAFQSNKRKAFNGLCMLMVKTTKKSGLITVQATSDTLQTASVSLRVE
ncbi:MAG: beta-galactosidase GalB [Flavobacteriaceae bacterium]|jgi:beta-galactosidase|nr:beta-galactosidase GalB [Flavobacteriaceae bacterium]